jgi:hypothetical protein
LTGILKNPIFYQTSGRYLDGLNDEFEEYLLKKYSSRTARKHSKYVFRGMSAKDLRDPLDPSFDPFEPIRPKLYRLIDVLEGLVQAGFALPKEDGFIVRMFRPLRGSDIEKVDEITPEKVRRLSS